MFSIKTLLILISVSIGGILLLLWNIKQRRKLESIINELTEIIKGNIKRKKLFLWYEFSIMGKFKGRDIFCNTFCDCSLWLEINIMPKNFRKTKIPFFVFKLTNKKITQEISINIFSGKLTYSLPFGRINKPYGEHIVRVLDELVAKVNEIESLAWERVIS